MSASSDLLSGSSGLAVALPGRSRLASFLGTSHQSLVARPRKVWGRHDFHVFLINVPAPPLVAGRGSLRRELASLAVLKSMCRNYGFHATVLDGVCDPRWSDVAHVVDEIAAQRRVVLGFHLMGHQWILGAKKILRGLRDRDVEVLSTFAGGNYATIYREEVVQSLPGLHRLVLGEGEFEFLRGIYEVMYGRAPPELSQMSSFTTIDPTATPQPDHYAAHLPGIEPIEVLTSRGCPGKCTFCEVACFYGKTRKAWRRRSLADVRHEILDVHQQTGQTFFDFLDDAFLSAGESSRERRHLLTMLSHVQTRIPGFMFGIYVKPETVDRSYFRQLHSVGLRKVFFGLESFNNDWLRLLRKAHTADHGIRALEVAAELGLDTSLGFIMIAPMFTIEDIRHELQMLRRHAAFPTISPAKLADATGNALLLYRHTKLYEIFKHYGWLREDIYDEEYEIFGYQVDPLVATYQKAMMRLRQEMSPALDYTSAMDVLSVAEETCRQLCDRRRVPR